MPRRIRSLPMVASLPWYDLPEIRPATDALWSELARQFRLIGLRGIPRQLNRDLAYERQWTSPKFLFGQACGYDVRIAYAGQLQIVATPQYDVPGCAGHSYSSYVIVREDSRFEHVEQLRGTRCVINTPTSHSGMNVLRALVAPLHTDGRFFSQVRISGAHELSLRMIQRGKVEVAAIDCVTYELLAAYRPQELRETRVLHRTDPVAAPPYVTASTTSPEMLAAMRCALVSTLEQPALAAAKARLRLQAVDVLPESAYHPIETLEQLAREHNYREFPAHELAAR